MIAVYFLALQAHRATTLQLLGGVLLMLRDGQTISARRFAVVVRAMLVAVAISAVGFGVAPIAAADGPYRNCTEAHQDGRWDIPQGDSDYWPAGDRDNDGIACES